MRFPRLLLAGKIHDLAICIWAAKFLFTGEYLFGGALLGWYSFVWFLRIIDFPEWFEWKLPDMWGHIILTVLYVLLFEAFLVWVYWKDAVDWIVFHY